MKFCMRCGCQLPEEAKFCAKCGSPCEPIDDASIKTEENPPLENHKTTTIKNPQGQTARKKDMASVAAAGAYIFVSVFYWIFYKYFVDNKGAQIFYIWWGIIVLILTTPKMINVIKKKDKKALYLFIAIIAVSLAAFIVNVVLFVK
ncbi:MAG: zinc-ribbon domain-containing protein [Christensenellales bacterium]|jgi:hypothetical protein